MHRVTAPPPATRVAVRRALWRGTSAHATAAWPPAACCTRGALWTGQHARAVPPPPAAVQLAWGEQTGEALATEDGRTAGEGVPRRRGLRRRPCRDGEGRLARASHTELGDGGIRIVWTRRRRYRRDP